MKASLVDRLGCSLYYRTVRPFVVKPKGNRLTLVMVVRNEVGRWLGATLAHCRRFIDDAVIVDDASTDQTADLCRAALEGVTLTLVSNAESRFSNEVELRRQSWDLAVAQQPDWLLFLDADELLDDRAPTRLRALIDHPGNDYYLARWYDFWDESHYRDDPPWNCGTRYSPFLIRYLRGFPYRWYDQPQHGGRMPGNVNWLRGARCEVRVKHYGWARAEDRQKKFERYQRLDPGEVYGGIPGQYASILDPNPHLVAWDENAP